MNVSICIGSSCHIKGSRHVVEGLKKLVEENNLSDKVELAGDFCTGNCQRGVAVAVDGVFHSVTPDTVEKFFNEEILKKL